METSAPCGWSVRLLVRFAICLLGIGFSISTGAAPRLEIERSVWDMGRIPNGREIEHSFKIRNAGDTDLDLRQVRPSCPECLSALARPAVLRPGQEGTIDCRFDPRFLAGPVTREVFVESNDPRGALQVLTLHAQVEAVFEIPPERFRLSPRPTEREARLMVRVIDPTLTNELKVLSAPDSVEVTIARVGSRQHVVSVRLVDPVSKGRQALHLILGTGDPRHATCLLTGELCNPHDLEFIPEALVFLPISQPQRRVLWIQQHGSTPMELVDVQATQGSFRFGVESAARRGEYRIQVFTVDLEGVQGEQVNLRLRFRDQSGAPHERTVPIRREWAGTSESTATGIQIANPSRDNSETTTSP